MSIPDAPAFCNRLTKEEYEQQAKKATSEAMKKLAEILNETAAKPDVLSISDSDSVSSSDEEESAKIRQLESRIHYLTLDLANATAEIETLREENANLNAEHLSHLQISNALRNAGHKYNELQFEKEEYLVRDLKKVIQTLDDDVNRLLPKVYDSVANKSYGLYYKKISDEFLEIQRQAEWNIFINRMIDTTIIILITIVFYVLLSRVL